MTFPQPSADTAAISGQEFFRLNTPLSSMGDLYETAQGAKAFALGPNSDIAAARVSYWDDTVPGGVSSIILSPDRSFVGLIAARNDVTYIKSNTRVGRTLISVDDLFSTAYMPTQIFNGDATPGIMGRPFDPARDVISFVQPVLDVIQYFVVPQSLVPQRSDRTSRFEFFSVATQPANFGVSVLVLPMYGRKSGYVNIRNLSSFTLGVQIGVARLSTSQFVPGVTGAAEAILVPFTPVVNSGVLTFSFKSSTDGLWDLLLLELGGGDQVHGGPSLGYSGGPVPIAITLSDDPQ